MKRPCPEYADTISLIAAGKTDKEIASRLCLSLRGVNERLLVMFREYNVESRTQLVVLALKNRWIVIDGIDPGISFMDAPHSVVIEELVKRPGLLNALVKYLVRNEQLCIRFYGG